MSVEGGVTTYFAWAGGKIIAEYEAWGTNALIWKKNYVYLGGRLLATTSGVDGDETRFHHPDRLGGTRLVTDAEDGAVVSEQLSMPFGTMLPFTQTYGGENSYQNPTLSNPSNKRFTSYDRSDMTGLDYAVNRFYSSQQGRFTQVDPLGMSAASLSNPQTLNLYAYCGNDPINHIDPYGLAALPWDLSINIDGITIPRAIRIVLRVVFITVRRGPSIAVARTPPTFGEFSSISLGDLLFSKIKIGIGANVDPRTPPLVSGFSDSSIGGVGDVGDCGGPDEPQCEPGLTARIVTWEDARSFAEWYEQVVMRDEFHGRRLVYNPPQVMEMGITYGALIRSIALGKDIAGGGLKSLAQQTGASWWRNWARDGITRRTVTNRFGRAFHQAVERADEIHFTLDGISDANSAVRAGAAGFRLGNFTNAELHYIATNPHLLQKTIFYRLGQVVRSPF